MKYGIIVLKSNMIASDEKFINNHLKNNVPVSPENEQKIERASKLEKTFSALGGALITYAASSSLKNSNKNWLHFGMAIVGGLLAFRGINNFIPKNQHLDHETSALPGSPEK